MVGGGAGFAESHGDFGEVPVSATLMLVGQQSDAPLSYGIYVFMQSAAGRGPGAALGIIAVVIVGLGTYLSHRVIERSRRMRTADRMVAETDPKMENRQP